MPPPVKAEEYYKGYLVNRDQMEGDPHFSMGCEFCHKGDETGVNKDVAHRGLVPRPSDDLKSCGLCHEQIAAKYSQSLHFTAAGLREGISRRFSAAELKKFDEKVFQQSCRSCHASCGDCHVKGPSVGGISTGLIKGHKFIRKDEGKTCAACHGGRIYPEYTGEYGGEPDIHYERGMLCMDCHQLPEFHGDGAMYKSMRMIPNRPDCKTCHKLGGEKKLYTRTAHDKHQGRVSCYGCHSSGSYRHCYNCHAGQNGTSKPVFLLGVNPRDPKTVTTLRLTPTVRDTFEKAGIRMEKFDTQPNYWDAPVHNVRKKTERTRSCDACHVERAGFLTNGRLIENGSRANERLIVVPKPISR